MLRLVLGTAGSGKTSFITGEIAKKIQAGERGICMIVPEQYSHEAERELCETCGGALSLGAEVFSFTRLAVRVAQEMGTGGKTYLDAGGRLLCMSLALRRIAPELKVFTRAGRDSRLQLELLRTIEELKAACIGYDELQRAAQVLEGELPAKLNDLSLCLEGYEAVLGNGHADPADRILHLADTIGLSKTAKSGQIYIDGFTDFTGAETRVINALIAAGTPVTVCLTLDSLTSESEHFAPARRAAGALMRYAREHGVECEEVYPDSAVGKDDALSFYIEHLFAYTDKSMKDEAGAIQIYRGGDLQSECENAAARCISLVRETGCRWRDIAIAARGFSDYSAVLTETFGLYGVPVFTARRGSIMQKPIPALIESVFSVILGSWSSEDVLAYMKTGLTGVSRDDCDTLERYVTLWSLRPGAWLKKGAWTQHPLGYGKEETPQSIELLDEINSIRRIISEPLMQLAKDGAAASTAGAQVRVLTDFLIRIKLPNTLEEHVRQLEEAGMSQLADEFSQLWSVLCEALQQFDALLGDTPMEQGEFSELFIKMLSCYDLASIPSSPDAVTAGEIDRMRRRNIKHLIFLGASDDRIPASSGSPGLLSEDERGTLEEAGLAVSGGSDSLDREFSLIYNCISLPSETLTISYGASGSEASRLRPSFLISRAALLLERL